MIVRDRAQGPADAGILKEDIEAEHHHQADADGEQVRFLDDDIEAHRLAPGIVDGEDGAFGEADLQELGIAAPDGLTEALDEKGGRRWSP